jgi:uncharacterized protein (DUF2267 family)
MSCTGLGSLDPSIDKSNAWLAFEEGFDAHDRRLVYRVARAWLHGPRDRLTVEVAAHFAAQLPALLRGVFCDGWNSNRVPLKCGWPEYLARFARETRIHEPDVPKAPAVVTATVRQHMSAGAVDVTFALLPGELRGPSRGKLHTGGKP